MKTNDRWRGLGIVLVTIILVIGFSFTIASAKELTIASIVPTMANEFYHYYVNFQKKVCKDLGVNLVLLNSQDNGERQVANIEDAISKKVDGLTIVPYWGTGIVAYRKCEKANTPIVGVDCTTEGADPQEQFKQYIAFVGPDDFQAGYNEAREVIRAMKPGKDGKKHIVALEGTPGISPAIWRYNGLKKAMQENPEVVLDAHQPADWLRDKAVKVTEDFIAAFPDFGGVWTGNDSMSIGALIALKRAGRIPGKDVFIGGIDVNKEALEAIEKGEMVCTNGGHWLQGGFAIMLLFDHLMGKPVPKDKSEIKVYMLTVTKDNLSRFYKKYPNGQPKYETRKHSRYFTPDGPDAYVPITLD